MGKRKLDKSPFSAFHFDICEFCRRIWTDGRCCDESMAERGRIDELRGRLRAVRESEAAKLEGATDE